MEILNLKDGYNILSHCLCSCKQGTVWGKESAVDVRRAQLAVRRVQCRESEVCGKKGAVCGKGSADVLPSFFQNLNFWGLSSPNISCSLKAARLQKTFFSSPFNGEKAQIISCMSIEYSWRY